MPDSMFFNDWETLLRTVIVGTLAYIALRDPGSVAPHADLRQACFHPF